MVARTAKAERFAASKTNTQSLRVDFLPKQTYLSKDFLTLENEKLWPKVWQIACRLEEIPKVGDYVTYEIASESIIIVRTAAKIIKSFYNVCQHRGRRLKDPSTSGNASTLYCRYHGWSWKIDGSVERILDQQDWEACNDFSKADLRLKETLVDTWAGWVFINMDLDAEPLAQFLDPVPQYLDPFEIDKMRLHWHKTTVFPCNWKVAIEAFAEGYHVSATHPQLLPFFDDITRSTVHGRHGSFGPAPTTRMVGAPSARLGKPVPKDWRPGFVAMFKEVYDTIRAEFSERGVRANTRLLTEVAADAQPMEVFVKAMEFQKQAAEAEGAGWPPVTLEQMGAAGADWHIFPNHILLQSPDAVICYRSRPNGNDPDSCIFDIWSLVRYAPGAEPPIKHEFIGDPYADPVGDFALILSQDLSNVAEVQAGMKSRGFAGSRTNPLQESSVWNLHRGIYEYLGIDTE